MQKYFDDMYRGVCEEGVGGGEQEPLDSSQAYL